MTSDHQVALPSTQDPQHFQNSASNVVSSPWGFVESNHSMRYLLSIPLGPSDTADYPIGPFLLRLPLSISNLRPGLILCLPLPAYRHQSTALRDRQPSSRLRKPCHVLSPIGIQVFFSLNISSPLFMIETSELCCRCRSLGMRRSVVLCF